MELGWQKKIHKKNMWNRGSVSPVLEDKIMKIVHISERQKTKSVT